MCFSAEASFIAGAVLTAAGLASVKKAQTKARIVFACIPLIFAAQQITEGFLWLALINPDFSNLEKPTTYIFLTFAQIIWPSWVPLSVLLMEKEKGRRKVLYLLTATGAIVSIYLAFRLLLFPSNAEIINNHIFYDLGFPDSIIRSFGVLYFIATVVPPLISSIKKMWFLGVIIFLSYLVTKMFFENYVISVWCFFAAVLSVAVYAIITDLKKPFSTADINKPIKIKPLIK